MVMLAKRLPKEVRRKIQRQMGIKEEKEQGQRKYRNVRVKLDGYTFDSKKEANRYLQLLMRKKVGEISDLQVHPRFDLEVQGKKVCSYIGDFQYYICHSDIKGSTLVVEDVKSTPTKTRLYGLKKKLMRSLLGIEIKEVM
jgi:hypothetical protein